MKPVSLNEYLSAENPWTRRLLGFEPFSKERSREFVEQLYDQEIWGERRRQYGEDPAKLKEVILNYDSDNELVISIQESLFHASLSSFQPYITALMASTLRKFEAASKVCELGCGIGRNLLLLGESDDDRHYYGGELAASGVEVANSIGLDVQKFDYYNPEDYEIIQPGSSVMTVHSIEQIPDAQAVIDNLSNVRTKIDKVFHFEPVSNPSRTNFLGLLRDRYKEINDYNQNLREILTSRRDIRILSEDFDIYGLNPLNPTSVIVWEFVN
jgi:hypothetical protein